MDAKEKTARRIRRHSRVRAKIVGTAKRPRLAVFRSNTQITAQIIDDEKGKTLASVVSGALKGDTPRKKSEAAGSLVAEIARNKKITEVVFDRGGFHYAGNIKAFANAARKAGLNF